MSAPRIIKKYPNRRLYDTVTSCYITLTDIKDLVVNCTPFQVIDAKTEEDVTNHILLQVINEEEKVQSSVFTTQILQNIIRLYDNPMKKAMSEFLEKGLNTFFENSKENNPLQAMVDLTKHNIEVWQSTLQAYSRPKKKQPDNKK